MANAIKTMFTECKVCGGYARFHASKHGRGYWLCTICKTVDIRPRYTPAALIPRSLPRSESLKSSGG